MRIKCNACNNIWSITWSNISAGKWCPVCAINKTRNSQQYVQEIILQNGGKLKNKYINNVSNLKILCFRCKKTFNTTFANIISGYWCKNCANGKSQRKLANIIKKIFNCDAKINYRGFKWLEGYNGGRQEIDIWVPELKLAIEYDGEQHFRPVRFGGISKIRAKKQFEYTKKLDKAKNRKIKQHPEDIKYFIRFNYKEKDKLCDEYVINRLLKEGIKI